jgi:hypothetical protein
MLILKNMLILKRAHYSKQGDVQKSPICKSALFEGVSCSEERMFKRE